MKSKYLLFFVSFIFPCFLSASEYLKLYTLSFPPYAYIEDGKTKGFTVEIVRAVFDKIGIKYEIRLESWARSLHKMKTGKADGLFPMLITDERKNFTKYSLKPVAYEYKSLFIHKDDRSIIHYDGDLLPLRKLRFCKVRGYSSGPIFDQAELQGILAYVDLANSSFQNIEKAVHKRCNILVDDKNVVLFLLNRERYSDQLVLLADLEKVPSYMGFSKFSIEDNLISQFDKAHYSLLSEGVIDKIIESYLGKNFSQQTSQKK